MRRQNFNKGQTKLKKLKKKFNSENVDANGLINAQRWQPQYGVRRRFKFFSKAM